MATIRPYEDDPHVLYEELSKLNSQMLTMQRELEKKNAELQRLAYYDTLTGLLNRRAILEKLDEWLRHTRRYHGLLVANLASPPGRSAKRPNGRIQTLHAEQSIASTWPSQQLRQAALGQKPAEPGLR